MKVKKVKAQKTSALSKAVSNVKQIIKKKDKEAKKQKDKEVIKKKSKDLIKKKDLKKTFADNKEDEIPFRSSRGVVYIGHIPYGFFESEMKEYFEQFGKVTKVRVARSKKTGKSRGYGYVEFDNTDVAKIAAETMNNYLMCGRLLKTTYIPPEKQHYGFFAGRPWTASIYPTLTNRIKELKKNESPISVKNYRKNVRRSLRQLADLEEKLKNEGVNVKFKPVNVPKDIKA